jgi:dihydroxyacetone kinase-like protein
MLCFVAARIEKEEAQLNALDASIGDGDHGITMRIGFHAIKTRLSSLTEDTALDATLGEAGRAFMGATGGAIGVILGKMLSAGKPVLKGCAVMGPAEFSRWLQAMETAVASTGKAKPGDKTVMDSLHAAAESASQSHAAGGTLREIASQAASAAETAAKNTADMVCKVGRASRLGERSLGHPDPGAVSFAIILRAISDWIEQNAQGR